MWSRVSLKCSVTKFSKVDGIGKKLFGNRGVKFHSVKLKKFAIGFILNSVDYEKPCDSGKGPTTYIHINVVKTPFK